MAIHRPMPIMPRVHKIVHFSELPPAAPESKEKAEWETYRREVGRLIAEGYEWRSVLIKEESIIGIYDTFREACEEGNRRFFPEDFMVHEIRTWEPIYLFMALLRPYRVKSSISSLADGSSTVPSTGASGPT